MSRYTSENTKVLETYDDNGNTRMLLMHEMDCGRHEYIIGSYFTESHEYIEPFGGSPDGVIVDRHGECWDVKTGHSLGLATNHLSWGDPDYYAAVIEDDRKRGNRIHYSWDWGHYFQRFEYAARYWLDEVIGVEFGFEAYDERSGFSEGEVFVELGDAIDAYVNWDFLDGGKKKRIYSIIGEDEVTLAECER